MESHADTIVAGKNCVVLYCIRQECDAQGFNDSLSEIINSCLARLATT